MNKIKWALIVIGFLTFLVGCKQNTKREVKKDVAENNKHYVSIDGLWRCTPETALKFPNGVLEPIIKLSGDVYGDLKVQGCFLWENRFYDYWDIDSIKFDDSTNQLEMVFEGGNIFRGVIDQDKKTIHGTAYSNEWGDPANRGYENQLDFIRDEQTDENRLFFSRPAGTNGSIKYAYHQPEQIDSYLQTASVFDFVKDSAAFYNLIERIVKQEFGRLESFLIIKDRKLVLEEYFYGYDQTQMHNIHSCTKSIVSLLLGITLERHKKLDFDQPFFKFFPQYDSLVTPEKEKITLKHVLTMTSGLSDFDDFETHHPDDLVKQMLIQPLESSPEKKFTYNNNGTNLLGSIINALEKKQADEFAKEVLFNKLGISEFVWEKENGVLRCYSDLHIFPRDMAKIGLLVL